MKSPVSLLALVFVGIISGRAETEAEFAARARAVHDRAFTIDTHLDTPGSLRRPGWDIGQRHDVATDYTQCDFPRMREGGLDAGVFAVYLAQGPRTPEGFAKARDDALKIFLTVREAVASHPNDCALALTAADGPRIAVTGKRAIYLSIENGYPIGRDLSLVRTYYSMGARIIGITHFTNNDLGDSATDPKGPEWGGLSPLGKEVVHECNRLGAIVDGSHASDAVLTQLIETSATPVILSHSGVRAIGDHPRNISDDLLRALAKSGGVIQMNTLSAYLVPTPPNPERNAALQKLMSRFNALGDPTPAQQAQFVVDRKKVEEKYPVIRATFDDFLRHLFHAIEVAGADHVGIGADMDGGGGAIGLEDVSAYPKITYALLKKGYSESDIDKIWGGNFLRLLATAEAYAKKAAGRDQAKAKAPAQ